MTVKNPYIPPDYGVVNTAIERRIEQAEKPAKPSKKKDAE